MLLSRFLHVAPSVTATFFLTLVSLSLGATKAEATIVRFHTVLGAIDARLYDTATPLTTTNFVNYANDGDWNNTFIHRSVPGFVVQGGGFTFSDAAGLANVPTDSPVQNEPGLSNLRGTIAMAKLGGDPNSATSQWFFNLSDNSANLDNQNGGFTVFGRVLGDGMDIVDAIAALPLVNAGSPFDTMPVVNWTSGTSITEQNLVIISSVELLNFADGDYNFDGQVDATDFTIWRNSLGSTTEVAADGNGDGLVDLLDYTIWQNAYSGVQTVNIPEPTSAVLLLLAAVLGHKTLARRHFS